MLLKLTHPSWRNWSSGGGAGGGGSGAASSMSLPPILLLWSNCDSSWPLDCWAGGPNDPSGDCLYAPRWALHAALSLDDGASWHGSLEVYRDPAIRTPPASESGDYGAAYPYGIEQADGTVVVKTGQSGSFPKRWGLFVLDPRWLLRLSKSADWSANGHPPAALPANGTGVVPDTDVANDNTVTSCVYLWNLCRDPSNRNRSAAHCDEGGDGVQLRTVHDAAGEQGEEGEEGEGEGGEVGAAKTQQALCAELVGNATQATVAWNFPAAEGGGALNLTFRLAAAAAADEVAAAELFGGANISLSDYLAPTFDQGVDYSEGQQQTASLAVLQIGQGGHLGAERQLPLGSWLTLWLQWSSAGAAGVYRYSYSIQGVDGSQITHGQMTHLKSAWARPPSYLRVRSLGRGAVCLRSASMAGQTGD